MMGEILVSGSIAYDYIMDFPDQFGKYILPDRTDKLSVNFNINKLEKRDGGAGHNICYNLALLGEKALLMGAVGEDFEATEKNKNTIDYRYTHISKSLGTPSAHIITDMENNQITAFYPGASIESGQQSIKEVKEDVVYAIVSPNNPSTMLKHLLECKELGIPVIFDPGQPLSAFNKEQLHQALASTSCLIVNEYELDLFCKLAEIEEENLLDYIEMYIVTLGAEGSRFMSKQETFHVTARPAEKVLDPTGAGDAFRAGVLWALKYNKGRKEGMEIGAKLASACVEKYGTQEHALNIESTSV